MYEQQICMLINLDKRLPMLKCKENYICLSKHSIYLQFSPQRNALARNILETTKL